MLPKSAGRRSRLRSPTEARWRSGNAVARLEAKLVIEGNREMLAWLRGEKAWHDEAEKRHRRVTLVNFEHTNANVFHVSWEWALKPPARKSNRRIMRQASD